MPDSLITKKALAASIKTLMLDRPIEKISVGDICAECGMSRKSFYYHFKDKYDLVNWIFLNEFVQPARSREYRDIWEFLTDLCGYFYKNRDYYDRAFSVGGQNSFSDFFIEVSKPLLRSYLMTNFGADGDCEFYSQFFSDAFRMSIVRWLKDKTSIEPRLFVGMFKKAVAGLVEKYRETPPE